MWKATEQDARDAGEPLARILNRYDGARRLAGMVDEAEFAAAMFAYAKRNLKLRGRVIHHAKTEQRDIPRYGGEAFDEMGGPQRVDRRGPVEQPPPVFVDESPPLVDEHVGGEDPNQPDVFAFDPWAAR